MNSNFLNPNNFEPDVARINTSIIKVIGVGGGGSNAVNHMYRQGIEGVEFFVCNTDAQALANSPVPNKIQMGLQLTEGLGAGSEPDMGRKAALESVVQITDVLRNNTKMAFITAGMGGGTGTGAAPVIAKISKELGILTVGIVTVPFEDEGPDKIEMAKKGIENLKPHVDALLTICNDRIVEMYGDLTISQAFSKADDILCTAAKGIAEIITVAGNINVDFKDVETAMKDSGRAIMGTGVAKGENRSETAARLALDSPLLDNTRIINAKHLLINLSYGNTEPTLAESSKIKKYFQNEAGNTARLKLGITHDSHLGDEISVTVIATGFEAAKTESTSTVENLTVIEEYSEEPAIGKEAVPFEETNLLDHSIDAAYDEIISSTLQERKRHEREKALNMLDDLNTPAYLRRNITLAKAPQSTDNNVSKISIADVNEEDTDQSIKKNPFLHDNVD